MEHAWLDSLSEDWVSQPGSDASDGQLPLSTQPTESSHQPDRPSRIPRRPGGKPFQSPANSSNILNERSANEINISRSRLPSKLAKEVKLETKDRRSVSTATCGSVVHNKAPEGLSPGKSQTPEWKRRLVHGGLQYGEQRDLFCSAAAGLQDMFKPPETQTDAPQDFNSLLDQTMPSSPPPYQYGDEEDIDRLLDLAEQEGLDFPEQVTPSPSPRRAKRHVNFRATSDDDPNSSPNDMSDLTEESPLQYVHGDHKQQPAYRNGSEVLPMRVASGQTDKHEDFSPILIGRQNENNGKVDFGQLDMPIEQLHEKLECLQHNQHADEYQVREPSFGVNIDRTSDMEAAEHFKNNAQHINLRRGGRSGDGSFYTRALSPDLGVDTSEMLPEESLQASTPKEFGTVRTQFDHHAPSLSPLTPSMPRAPFPSPDKHELQIKGSVKASGSPLKLFGPYDTFTNQTLLRRISQYEDVNSGNSSQRTTGTEKAAPNSKMPARRTVSQFGGGDLDNFEFTGDLSDASKVFNGTDKENVSPEAHMVPIGSRRQVSLGNASKILVSRRRDRSDSSNSVSSAAGSIDDLPADDDETRLSTSRRRDSIDAKRTRASPVKDPTPKRRRTLHRSDVAFGRDEDMAANDGPHQHLQLALAKRKDARPGQFELADPDVLALRRILQPRSPASSRNSSRQYRDEGEEINNVKQRESPKRSKHGENQSKASAADVEAVRKPSIRTQDFVDQAAQIMAMIRNQVKPSGLSSLEESVAEMNQTGQPAPASESHQDSTYEPFSRPPSRDGKQMPNQKDRLNDPELEHRLRKYRELSDMGEVVSSSMRSVSIAQDAIRAAQELERQMEQRNILRNVGPLSALGEITSDMPNVQITAAEGRIHPAGSPARDYPSHSSARSNGSSVPTGSSRGSDSRRTIMPESVSHLIPDKVGSMYLDKTQNIWVKQKEQTNSLVDEKTQSDSSEDDPFADIPDLTVDMTEELQNLKRTGDKDKSPLLIGAETPYNNSSYPSRRGYITLSPDGKIPLGMNAAARDEFEKLDSRTTTGSGSDADTKHSTHNHTITSGTSTARRRNMTISFSSPIASIIRDVAAEDIDSLEDDEDFHESLESGDASPDQSPVQAFGGKPAIRNGASRPPTRYASQHGREFFGRPVSRIDEQDEESTVEVQADSDGNGSYLAEQSLISRTHERRQTSLSFIISRTPGHHAVALAGDESALIGQNVGKLSLSPLSEFTVNQDQSFGFEVSYVMDRRHLETGNGSRRVMSVTIRDLVDKLSEVEPYEPFWEDIDELDLSDKRLSSLHMLDEFCGRVVTLDASQNMLGHLEGVPSSVRQLKASQNMLTELTSWDHLINLQYVDISGNEVKSLSALKNLVHLRSLKADKNKLTSLDGLDVHDGLLSLRARENMIEELDFSGLVLSRLTDLDLDGNCLESVRNLEQLPALTRLKLSNNKLEKFEVGDTMKSLRHLDLGGNRLTAIDVSNLPNLQTLHVDGNYISTVDGLHRTRRLDSLSLREQRGEQPLDLGFLASGYEVRKLFLSGNCMEAFEPKVDMLNLQLLELANCGLGSLPENLGQLMPNLRALNANFNALSDLEPLRFIPRLKKLLVAGNRLRDSTCVTELLMDFPHLTRLDVRDNPMTQGFYTSLQALVQANSGDEGVSPFCLPDADEERDEQYASRLDEPTKLRRRLHQVVLAASCRRLRMLDGLALRRKNVLAMDSLMRALVEEGLVPSPATGEDGDAVQTSTMQKLPQILEEAEEAAEDDAGEEPQSSRWHAEDSFA